MTAILQLVTLLMLCAAGVYGAAGFVFLVAFGALGLAAGVAIAGAVTAIVRAIVALRAALDALAQQWRYVRQIRQLGAIGS
jgi:hypothetical protein